MKERSPHAAPSPIKGVAPIPAAVIASTLDAIAPALPVNTERSRKTIKFM